ncbi:hypothetical protein CF326_g5803 [Tilletia indica]|nr:hypothetical protein CF326_g5803 [Tilletia indica]
MGLLLAPYNNAMRLGQGFNSYTHEICIDDAVVVSPQRAENVLTNDGNTMRLAALVAGKPSAWTKQPQVLLDISRLEEAQNKRKLIEEEKSSGNAELLEAAETEAIAAVQQAADTERLAQARAEMVAADEAVQEAAAGHNLDAAPATADSVIGSSDAAIANSTSLDLPSDAGETTAAPTAAADRSAEAQTGTDSDALQPDAPSGDAPEPADSATQQPEASKTEESEPTGIPSRSADTGADDNDFASEAITTEEEQDVDVLKNASTSGDNAKEEGEPKDIETDPAKTGDSAAEIITAQSAADSDDLPKGNSSPKPSESQEHSEEWESIGDKKKSDENEAVPPADEGDNALAEKDSPTEEDAHVSDTIEAQGQKDATGIHPVDATADIDESKKTDVDAAVPEDDEDVQAPEEEVPSTPIPSAAMPAKLADVPPPKTEADIAAEEAANEKRVAEDAARDEAARVAALQLKRKQEELTLAKQRRERDPKMLEAANKFKLNLSLEKMAEMHKDFLLPKSAHKAPNMGKAQVFNIQTSTGVSQTVIFQSRFVDRLSDITSDLGISAGLSIKKGSCGGSGRGSFIDTDKFKSSDMNFYISVKVTNQSINFKDNLEFQPLDNIGAEDFRSVFGDCFISGFLEGGELNALISMKVLNKSKSVDIKAEGAIALGKESVDISAKGAYQTAKSNLDLNTETSVQVSWIGGGCIKPPEEAWTVESLSRAATRFPDHVAQSPQRTYAILTKYETLRSFQALKPQELTAIDYENAILYTNELMDTFMSYKAIYGRLTSQIAAVQSGTHKFKKVEREAERKAAQEEELTDVEAHRTLETLSDAEKKAKIGFFPSTLDGLDDARRAVRMQMNLIINRVDEITEDPNRVLSQSNEKFLPSFAFETLLPMLESAFRSNKRTAPLTGERMFGEDLNKQEDTPSTTAHRMCLVRKPAENASSGQAPSDDGKNKATEVIASSRMVIKLLREELIAIEKFLSARDEGIEDSLRLTPPMGNEWSNPPPGNLFTALDFVQPAFVLRSVTVTVSDGIVSGLVCKYINGISWRRGVNDPKSTFTLQLASDERITSAIITAGTEAVFKSPDYVISLKLITNRGNSLLAHEPKVRRAGFNRRLIGARAFFDVRSVTWESPLERGYTIGFWGWSSEKGAAPGISRLGLVWANQDAVEVDLTEDAKKVAASKHDLEHEEKVGQEETLKRKLEELQRTSESKVLKFNELLAELETKNEANNVAVRESSLRTTAAQAQVKAAEEKIKELEVLVASVKTAADSNEARLREDVQNSSADRARLDAGLATATEKLQTQEAALRALETKKADVELQLTTLTSMKASADAEYARERNRLTTQLQLSKGIDFTFRLQHVRDKFLHHNIQRRDGTLYDRHDGWNQIFRAQRHGPGFKIFTMAPEPDNTLWYLRVSEERYQWPDCKKLVCDSNDFSTFSFEPAGDDWFYIRLSRNWSWTLNPWNGRNDNDSQVIGFEGGKGFNDKWRFAF